MEQNKTRSYFLYAIGEILLVVAGILIALQVNTWNQARQNNDLIKTYYGNLVKELDSQMAEITIHRGGLLVTESALIRSIQKINNSLELADIEEFNKDLGVISITRTIHLYDATFEDLKSTGNLSLIKNEELKANILDFYQYSSRLVYVMRKNAESFHYFSLERVLDQNLVNVDMSGMSDFPGVKEMLHIIDEEMYAPDVNQRMNEVVLMKYKDPENLLMLKNGITNSVWINEVALFFISEMEDRAKALKAELQKELQSI